MKEIQTCEEPKGKTIIHILISYFRVKYGEIAGKIEDINTHVHGTSLSMQENMGALKGSIETRGNNFQNRELKPLKPSEMGKQRISVGERSF